MCWWCVGFYNRLHHHVLQQRRWTSSPEADRLTDRQYTPSTHCTQCIDSLLTTEGPSQFNSTLLPITADLQLIPRVNNSSKSAVIQSHRNFLRYKQRAFIVSSFKTDDHLIINILNREHAYFGQPNQTK